MSNINDKNINDFNISICSYNILWKIMNNKISPFIKTLGKEKIFKHKSNILKNIFLIKNYYNPFFYCFQEASNYQEIIELFNEPEYSFHYNYSEPEYMLTIWNNKLFQSKFKIDGEFEPGRPFCLFVFEDLRFNIQFVLINIHAGHLKNTLKSIFEPIQKYIDINSNKTKKFDIKRIIIGGDFNRDISSQINLESDKYNLIINSKKYNFIPFLTKNNTCCSLNGWGHNKNYDQIIDSYDKPIITHVLNQEKWYNKFSSDHILILSIIKNFI
jgi:hypothetical protein